MDLMFVFAIRFFLCVFPTSFVGTDGAGRAGTDSLGINDLDRDEVPRERFEAFDDVVRDLGVVHDDLPHVFLRPPVVLVVLSVGDPVAEELAVDGGRIGRKPRDANGSCGQVLGGGDLRSAAGNLKKRKVYTGYQRK